MHFAINENGKKIKAFPEGRAICPNCNSTVIAKCGELNIWHWAHESLCNCDSWNYEPITEWHLNWQGNFNEAEIEVYIYKDSECHRADIYTSKQIVIEIQNSPISSSEIYERENFYNKMIWVINTKEFKHNLILRNFPYDIGTEAWYSWIKPSPPSDKDNAYAIFIPFDDTNEQILKALKKCNYKRAFDPDLKSHFYFNKKIQFQQPLDKEVHNAFCSYLQDTKMVHMLDVNTNYSTNFKWNYLRKSWSNATKPIFLDLNNGFLLYIKTLYENGNGFGKIVSKRTFLNKYRS